MERWQYLFATFGGRLIGMIAALLLALVILEYGLLRTVFILLLVSVGWLIGLRIDETGGLAEFAARLGRRD